MCDDIVDHQPDLIAHQLALQPIARGVGIAPLHRAPLVLQQIKFEQILQRQETRPQTVINVVIVVGNVVGNRGDLSLQRWPLS